MNPQFFGMVINQLVRSQEGSLMTNASHRAVAATPSSPQAVSPLRASIDFRGGPATEWLERAGPLAAQLNEESKKDEDNGD